jgi:hypothetical protein
VLARKEANQSLRKFRRAGTISLRLIAGLALLMIGAGGCGTRASPGSSSLPSRRSQESKAKAVAEKNLIRREAAGKFRELASDHEAASRQRLANAITRCAAQYRQKENVYADGLLSTGATLRLARAWYDDQLAAMPATATEQRMLSRQALAKADAAATVLTMNARRLSAGRFGAGRVGGPLFGLESADFISGHCRRSELASQVQTTWPP